MPHPIRPRSRTILSLVLASVLAACRNTDATAPTALVRDTSPLQTDALSYTLVRGPREYTTTVTATFVNTTGAPVYYRRCGIASTSPMFDLRLTGPDSTRTDVFTGVAWACVGGVPTGSLTPGEQVTIRVPFGGPDQPRAQPPITPERYTGRFRILLGLCVRYEADSDACERVPDRARQSNAFEIRL